jgi:hypothetical protein
MGNYFSNHNKYNKNDWIGLTRDEVNIKMKKVFGNSVKYMFRDEFRITEQYYPDLLTFKVVDNKVVDTRWH